MLKKKEVNKHHTHKKRRGPGTQKRKKKNQKHTTPTFESGQKRTFKQRAKILQV